MYVNIIALIEKVREHELIYNYRLPDYRDQTIRQITWEEIGRELDISAAKAKTSWEKLRRCFCNVRNRRREKDKNGIAKKNSLWKYEQEMEFLLPFLDGRKSSKNLNESQSLSFFTDHEDILTEKSDIEDLTQNIMIKEEFFNFDNEHEEFTQNSIASVEEVASTDTKDDDEPKNKKDLFEVTAHSSSNSRKRKYEGGGRSPVLTRNCLFEGLDETDLFFLSMSRMTKQLPKIEQAQIKLELSNSVLSAEIRNAQGSLEEETNS